MSDAVVNRIMSAPLDVKRQLFGRVAAEVIGHGYRCAPNPFHYDRPRQRQICGEIDVNRCAAEMQCFLARRRGSLRAIGDDQTEGQR